MNKNQLFIGLSSISLCLVGMVAVVSANNVNDVNQSVKAVDPNYTLTMDVDTTLGTYAGLGGGGFTYTNARGTTFGFFKTAGVTRNSNGAALYYDGNEDNVILIRSEYNSNESMAHSINGIKSITVDYEGTYYQEDGKPNVVPTIQYGFIHDNTGNYTYEHTLEDNTSFNFDNLLPDCFKIVISNSEVTNKWYRCKIVSLTITYSCSPSDTLKNAWLDDYFAATPKNVVRDGEGVVTSFQSGAFPQSRAESAVETYLEANYSSMVAINGYYLRNGYLYARKQATNTGLSGEYTTNNYYWFKVEPVDWVVLSHEGDNYYAYTEHVIDHGVNYHNNTSIDSKYSVTTLRTYINGIYDVMFRNVGTLIATNEDVNVNAKLYPLSYYDLTVSLSTDARRWSTPTAYSRRTYIYSSLDNAASYWSVGPSANQPYYVGTDGKMYCDKAANSYKSGVRPSMTITIE